MPVVFAGLYAVMDRTACSNARGIVQIAPRVSGRGSQVRAADAAVVQADDPLISLDARPFELEGGMEHWPYAARAGYKARVVVFAPGENDPLALIARAGRSVRPRPSFLH